MNGGTLAKKFIPELDLIEPYFDSFGDLVQLTYDIYFLKVNHFSGAIDVNEFEIREVKKDTFQYLIPRTDQEISSIDWYRLAIR